MSKYENSEWGVQGRNIGNQSIVMSIGNKEKFEVWYLSGRYHQLMQVKATLDEAINYKYNMEDEIKGRLEGELKIVRCKTTRTLIS